MLSDMLVCYVWRRLHKGVLAFKQAHLDRLYENSKAVMMDIGLTKAELTDLVPPTGLKYPFPSFGKLTRLCAYVLHGPLIPAMQDMNWNLSEGWESL